VSSILYPIYMWVRTFKFFKIRNILWILKFPNFISFTLWFFGNMGSMFFTKHSPLNFFIKIIFGLGLWKTILICKDVIKIQIFYSHIFNLHISHLAQLPMIIMIMHKCIYLQKLTIFIGIWHGYWLLILWLYLTIDLKTLQNHLSAPLLIKSIPRTPRSHQGVQVWGVSTSQTKPNKQTSFIDRCYKQNVLNNV
jgi:hypothetical protein